MTTDPASRPPDVRRLSPGDGHKLATLFSALVDHGDKSFFHPHPLTDDFARFLAERYAGSDVYLVALSGERIVGYGMLRGWDEGYSVPSLGVAVHPAARGRGVGRALMEALHLAAAARGAQSIRLRVHGDNAAALTLYRHLGYAFDALEDGLLVGHLTLST